MRILWPEVRYQAADRSLAPRRASLDGAVVAFLDGWGERQSDGSFRMYPLMRLLRERLEARHQLGGTRWLKKPNISQPLEAAVLAEVARTADVVVNGECA